MTSPISVQLYTLRDQIAQDHDTALTRLAAIGYTAVEPFDPMNDPKGFRRTADDLGLTVTSTHAYALLQPDADQDAVFDAVATLGTDLVVIPGGIAPEEFTSHDGIRRTADLLNGFAVDAARHGMRIGYHNHWWELESRIDGRHALEALADLLAPEVFLEIDTYWAAVGGADVPALLRGLGERVLALHVKDGPGVRNEPNTAVGQGTMPIADFLAAAPTAQRIVELDSCTGDVFDALAQSHAYLARLERTA
ncbi:sugar phosphate isomerase/epimerase family protein [Streptacidiphilus sp. MAP5-3]|uniref:sugar phosphate isomerase/epimerase family protein n=1 Tax=unclassified Streptacidiphilus TaxID=2643834 RepID=UPI003518DCD6